MQSIMLEEVRMLGDLRVDAQAVAVIIEVLHLIKYAIFKVNPGLQTLGSSDSLAAQKF